MTRFVMTALAYLVPTFLLGFVWHLMLFRSYYDALAIYRPNIIVPFGFLSMSIQALIFAWVYEVAFASRSSRLRTKVVTYGVVGALLSWSFTTLAAAAKNVMTSVPDFLLIETAFTIVQWMMVAPLTVVSDLRWPP
jgi:hypothetical protein